MIMWYMFYVWICDIVSRKMKNILASTNSWCARGSYSFALINYSTVLIYLQQWILALWLLQSHKRASWSFSVFCDVQYRGEFHDDGVNDQRRNNDVITQFKGRKIKNNKEAITILILFMVFISNNTAYWYKMYTNITQKQTKKYM